MILILLIGAVGLLCLYAEFFLPGGILALIAFLLGVLSVILFFLQTTPLLGLGYLVLFGLLSYFTCRFALKIVRKSKNSFCLQEDQEGFVSAEFLEDLTGKQGVVCSELKPAGHVRIEGKVYQAVSQGEFIVRESPIEVVSMRGSHLIVKLKKKEKDESSTR